MTLKTTLLLLATLLLNACTLQPRYLVNVDSIGEAHLDKSSYILLPADKNISNNDLQFKEYATYVHRALKKNNFTLADNKNHADIAIYLGYGVGAPQDNIYSYDIPTWGYTGVYISHASHAHSGNAHVSGAVSYTPTFGITGTATHTDSYTTYVRFMFLDAVDLAVYRNTKEEVQLWKTSVSSTGRSSDLRRIFPILVAASADHIATNTKGKIHLKLYENDAEILAIKGVSKKPNQPHKK